MGMVNGRRPALRLGLLAMLALTACGVGSQVIPPYVEGVVGTGGGTVQTQFIKLDLPAGALTQDTVVRILPQPTPLPIDPLAGSISYMPGLMCIGPVGQVLVVQAQVRVCYDPASLPAGATEADLVLLEWDNLFGLMRVSGTAVQDLVGHCFTDSVYFELGHIGVGVRTGAPFSFVFPGGPLSPVLAPVVAQGGVQAAQLHLASPEGIVAPVPLPNSIDAQLHIPSRAGDRVMYTLYDNPTESSFLESADVEGGGQRNLVAPDDDFVANDRFVGWLEGDVALFVESSRFDGKFFIDVLRVVGGSGAPAPSDLAEMPIGTYLADLRISPDGSLILVRLVDNFSKGTFESLNVYDAVTGELVGEGIPGIPFGSSSPMPRWLPDSSGIYWLDQKGNQVDGVDADGTNLVTLFTPPAPIAFDTLLDFVLSPTTWDAGTPATVRCAYVRRNFGQVVAAGVQTGPVDLLTVSNLDGTGLYETALSSLVVVNELVYHPNGNLVFGDFSPPLVRGGGIESEAVAPGPGQTVQFFHGATAGLLRSFVTSLADLDVDRVDGRVLLWIQGALQDPVLQESGLYAFPADVSTVAMVDIGSLVPVGPPRFLHSWRRCPGTDSSSVR